MSEQGLRHTAVLSNASLTKPDGSAESNLSITQLSVSHTHTALGHLISLSLVPILSIMKPVHTFLLTTSKEPNANIYNFQYKP